MIPFLKILMIEIWLVSQISFLTNTLLVSLFSHFLPPPYWSLSDAPLSYRWLAANHKFNCLEPGGRDDKFPVNGELCLPPEHVRVCETDFINEDPCIKFQKQDMSERLDNFCKKQTVCKQSIWDWFRKF